MSRETRLFEDSCSYSYQTSVLPVCMRVAFQMRYQIPFAFTLEMSTGGCDLKQPLLQMTPNDYREIGSSVVNSLQTIFIEDSIMLSRVKSLPPSTFKSGKVSSQPSTRKE
jgi:hypothetical protein